MTIPIFVPKAKIYNMSSLFRLGQYILLMRQTLTPPERWSVFMKQFFDETYKLIINSIWIVVIISVFIGAVIVMQIA